MAARPSKPKSMAVLIRSARIVSGLFLLAFITTHLLNMMLGLYSIELVDEMRPYLTGLWVGPIGSKLLIVVLMVHFVLALQAIYMRETLRMSPNDMVQFVAGLLIMPTLIPHAIGIGAMNEIYSDASYVAMLKFFWLMDPFAGLRQVLLVGIVWVHGCMGLFIWLRSKKWAIRVLPLLYPLAVAIPVLALLGYVETGREILIERHQSKLAQTVDKPSSGYDQSEQYSKYGTEPLDENPQKPEPKVDAAAIVAQSYEITSWILWITTIFVLLTLLARFFRVRGNRKNMLEVDYLHGPILNVQTGPSMLDIARHNDLPHANLCHGRGRCGTCRIRVLSSSKVLPAPTLLEQKTLDRLNCGPGVRLACQLSPTGGLMRVERILPADHQYIAGQEDNTSELEAK